MYEALAVGGGDGIVKYWGDTTNLMSVLHC